MDKVGLRPQVFKSGRYKDMLSGEREPDAEKLTAQEQKDRDEEDQMVQNIINETYNKFKEVVKTGRHGPPPRMARRASPWRRIGRNLPTGVS